MEAREDVLNKAEIESLYYGEFNNGKRDCGDLLWNCKDVGKEDGV